MGQRGRGRTQSTGEGSVKPRWRAPGRGAPGAKCGSRLNLLLRRSMKRCHRVNSQARCRGSMHGSNAREQCTRAMHESNAREQCRKSIPAGRASCVDTRPVRLGDDTATRFCEALGPRVGSSPARHHKECLCTRHGFGASPDPAPTGAVRVIAEQVGVPVLRDQEAADKGSAQV